jgi:N utilization substance protein B
LKNRYKNSNFAYKFCINNKPIANYPKKPTKQHPMYSRRHLRVKVLQTLYAYHQSHIENLEKGENLLLKNAQELYTMYWYNLLLLEDICAFTVRYADFEDGKMMATLHNKKLDRKFADNIFATTLQRSPQYTKAIQARTLQNELSTEAMRTLFEALITSPEYQAYITNAENTAEETSNLIQNFYRNIVLKNVDVEAHFEDVSPHWQSDKEHIRAGILRTIKSLHDSNGTAFTFENISENWTEDRQTMTHLFRHAVLNYNEYALLIESKAKNWEAERIAPMDRLLLIIALTEIMHFESIPTKVSINEYIEIAKMYSTPKSKVFINGVLDAIVKELKAEGKIVKTGRGLVE